ncbi:GNAT family N-acetyltransferase [Eubacteriales bacterium OttesenSCG-928-A19]|nr:GNAT family N-acetyltransferase [Eubacteriales bacterium OttesenSCG-928-A19]
MTIRSLEPRDIPAIVRLWNDSASAGEVLYKSVTSESFTAKFLRSDAYFPSCSLVAERDGVIDGYICGVMKRSFLPGETHANTPGYLTVLFVDRGARRQGIAAALLDALSRAMRAEGKRSIVCRETNPVHLNWYIPGTPMHDHNKAPGVDTECPGYSFLLSRGFADRYHEVAMYMPLEAYVCDPGIDALRERLRAEGIETGPYDVRLRYDYDRMCNRIGNEYWRKAIGDELSSPAPRLMLTATHEGHIVGFTGPVDREPSGRGFFMGICTDPCYEKHGIASVLFNLLLQAFIAHGATFSTLFTADSNHAKRLYLRTGFREARHFAMMEKAL